MMQSPDLSCSILINTYNHERFIAACLDSVFAQDHLAAGHAHEVIVVSDGSTDGTHDIVRGYGDRVRLIAKENGGQSTAFNTGLEHCTGDIVLLLDGDDWWHPTKVSRVMAEFAAHPGCVAVGHGIVVVDEMAGSSEEQRPADTIVLNFAERGAIAAFHANMSFLGTSRLAARRATLADIAPVPEPLTYEADEYFFTLLPAVGDVRILPQCLTYYRLHGNNLYQASMALAGEAMARTKLVKRAGIFTCLATVLPAELQKRGVSEADALAINEVIDVQATRLRLQAGGGSRIATFAIERRARALARSAGAAQKPVVTIATSLLSLLVPPQRFYDFRTAYTRSSVRRILNSTGR